MRAALTLLLTLSASTALAGAAEEAAVAAADALDRHCAADLLGSDVTLKAGSLKEVASVWEAVSAAYDEEPLLYLLYWRGALAQCLGGFDDNARADLEAFWTGAEGDTSLVDQRTDATRRLRRLGVTVGGQEATVGRPALGIGVGLVAAGGAFAGLGTWQFAELKGAEGRYTQGGQDTAAVDAARREGETAATATNALVSAAVGLAVASAPLFLVDALLFVPKAQAGRSERTGADSRRAGAPAVVLPTASVSLDGSLRFGLAGRW